MRGWPRWMCHGRRCAPNLQHKISVVVFCDDKTPWNQSSFCWFIWSRFGAVSARCDWLRAWPRCLRMAGPFDEGFVPLEVPWSARCSALCA